MSIGFSQEALAEELEVNVKTIQRYEAGKSRPDTHTLIKMATFFDVSTDYLLGLIGLIAQIAEEEKKGISQQGGQNPLYKKYIKCKSSVEIDESADYYWICYEENGHIGGQTQWVGWANEGKRIEIRRLRPVIPSKAVKICTDVYNRPLLINSKQDVETFLIYGGQAIVKADICQKYLPEFCEDYICR